MALSLDLAIAAIRSGRGEEGRQLLNLLIQQNPNNEMAWLWMSEVVDTDEQRARCLYHVLAINPKSNLAQQGLQKLGIVVTDSRPIRAIRQSLASLPAVKATASAPIAVERRPRRIDHKAITQELPFKPLREPFSETNGQNGTNGHGTADPQKTILPAMVISSEQSIEPTPQAEITAPAESVLPMLRQAQHDTNDTEQANQPVKPENGTAPQAILSQPQPQFPQPQPQFQPPPNYYAQPQPQMMPVYAGPQDTRPAPPTFMPHAQTMGMPMMYANPPDAVPVVYANTTLGGMSYPQAQGYLPQPHANATLAMPVNSNGAMALPNQFPQHASATIGMPSDHELIAAWQNSHPTPQADYRVTNGAWPQNKSKKKKPLELEAEESNDNVNIWAVIIFGSLSVTALGGLGILALLMVTT